MNGAWFASVPDDLYRQYAVKYRSRFGAAPYRLSSLGYDAVLLNTAVAKAGDPAAMAAAFARAVEAGHAAWRAGMLEPRDMAVPSTPVIGQAVFP